MTAGAQFAKYGRQVAMIRIKCWSAKIIAARQVRFVVSSSFSVEPVVWVDGGKKCIAHSFDL
jgi:hypothetical protein